MGETEGARMGMVQEQCSGLSIAIDNLGELVDGLGEMLIPVLRQEPESLDESGEDQVINCPLTDINCPLAEQIHGYELRISRIIKVLVDYLQRLEV